LAIWAGHQYYERPAVPTGSTARRLYHFWLRCLGENARCEIELVCRLGSTVLAGGGRGNERRQSNTLAGSVVDADDIRRAELPSLQIAHRGPDLNLRRTVRQVRDAVEQGHCVKIGQAERFAPTALLTAVRRHDPLW